MTTPDTKPEDGGTPQGDPPKPGENQGGGQRQDDSTPKFTQADYNRFEATVRHNYQRQAEKDAELIAKGKKFEAMEQEQKPLSEQIQSISAESAQKDGVIAEKDRAITRLNLAWEAGLPPALGRRVVGNTEDEIKADIEAIKNDMAAAGVPAGTPGGGLRPNPQQGAPSPDQKRSGSTAAGRELWEQRHGKKKADAAT